MGGYLRGVDVSSVQDHPDWSRVPAWCRYVFCKATEGESGVDPTVLRNLLEAAKSGRFAFVYHFLRTSQDPVKQAKNLYLHCGPDHPLFVMLDFETLADGLTPDQGVEKALACADEIEADFGRPPGLYGFPWFDGHVLGEALARHPRIARLPLIMADYSGGEDPTPPWHPFTPKPWGSWAFAQTSGNNSSFVDGIPGHVDHDVFNGDEQALRDFLGLGATIPAGAEIVPPSVDFPDRDYSEGPGQGG